MKKHKIIDTIFFYDEIDMLIFRLTELYDHVDHFIIMESETDFNGNFKSLIYKENESLFDKWKDKITYQPTYSLTDEDFDYMIKILSKSDFSTDKPTTEINRRNIQSCQLVKLYHHLLSLDLYMEDLIMISDVDEIPDLSKLTEILDKISFSPVILRQKNFIWSTEFVNTLPNLGTICLQYTNLIIKPYYFFNYYFKRTFSTLRSFEVVDSGYHLSHFYSFEKTKEKFKILNPTISDSQIENCWNDLISVATDEYGNVYSLVEYEGELPKNIGLLKMQNIGRKEIKKHFIVINPNLEEPEKYFELDGDFVYLINFTEIPTLPFKLQLSDKVSQYNILVPNVKYYDIFIEENTLENFQKMFGFNEIKKIMSEKLPLKKDLFIFFDGSNFNNLLSIPWSDLKDGFVYDKIYNIK